MPSIAQGRPAKAPDKQVSGRFNLAPTGCTVSLQCAATEQRRNVREDQAMRCKSLLLAVALRILGALPLASTPYAQGAGGPGTPWRGAGAQPCFGPEGGAFQCPPPAQTI